MLVLQRITWRKTDRQLLQAGHQYSYSINTIQVHASIRTYINPVLYQSLAQVNNLNTSQLPTNNKTRTPQVGAISKAQKAQNIFLEKNLKFSKKNFFRKMSHSAEKCKRGDPF